jgi:Domain of Unknown Function (DUF1080)
MSVQHTCFSAAALWSLLKKWDRHPSNACRNNFRWQKAVEVRGWHTSQNREIISAPVATVCDSIRRHAQDLGSQSHFFRRLLWVSALAVLAGCSVNQPGTSTGTAKVTGESQGENTAAKSGQKAPTAEPAKLLTEAELSEGWIALFDGQTLFGWKANSQANWAVQDGSITVSGGQKGLLCTTTEFADYALKVDFRCEPDTNSGVFLQTSLSPADPAKDCYEVNLAGPDNPFPTGSLVKRKKADGTSESRDWQSCEVTVEGPRVAVKLNGQSLLDYRDPQPLRRGHIGLQFNEGRVAFRNVKLKPLGLTSLFDGKSLAGWKSYPNMAGKFSVSEEGCLRVQGGRGQLESAQNYADFALQLECITHAPNVNSGVFFRCIPGQELMGYEAQIHNGFKDGDRSQPADCGTGGIFRRQAARRVVADDRKWFHETLLAHGLHVAVWVDGYQVTDWVDQRPPDENPRNGLRLEPGTIMIQAHDAATDLSFRKLRAAELAKRQE